MCAIRTPFSTSALVYADLYIFEALGKNCLLESAYEWLIPCIMGRGISAQKPFSPSLCPSPNIAGYLYQVARLTWGIDYDEFIEQPYG